MKPFPQRAPEEPSYGRKKSNRFITWLNKGDNTFWLLFAFAWAIVLAGTIYAYR